MDVVLFDGGRLYVTAITRFIKVADLAFDRPSEEQGRTVRSTQPYLTLDVDELLATGQDGVVVKVLQTHPFDFSREAPGMVMRVTAQMGEAHSLARQEVVVERVEEQMASSSLRIGGEDDFEWATLTAVSSELPGDATPPASYSQVPRATDTATWQSVSGAEEAMNADTDGREGSSSEHVDGDTSSFGESEMSIPEPPTPPQTPPTTAYSPQTSQTRMDSIPRWLAPGMQDPIGTPRNPRGPVPGPLALWGLGYSWERCVEIWAEIEILTPVWQASREYWREVVDFERRRLGEN